MTRESRAFQDEADYELIRRFLVATHPRFDTRLYCTIGDLDWWRWTEDDPAAIRRIRLWLDRSGAVIGFAWPSDDDVDIVVHPDHVELFVAMLTWSEQRLRSAEGGQPSLTAWSFASDTARQDVLRRRGYEPTDAAYYLRRRSLAEPPPDPCFRPATPSATSPVKRTSTGGSRSTGMPSRRRR